MAGSLWIANITGAEATRQADALRAERDVVEVQTVERSGIIVAFSVSSGPTVEAAYDYLLDVLQAHGVPLESVDSVAAAS